MKPSGPASTPDQSLLKEEDGFTLIEIIAALVILATGFLTVLQLFQGGVQLATSSDRYIRGVNLANTKFSELELVNFQTEENSGGFELDPDYRWEYEVAPFASPLNDPGVGIQLNQVTLKVLWSEGKEEKQIQLASLWEEGNTTRLAPDTVLLGNTAGLSSGGGSAADSPTATSSDGGGNLAATTTGSGGFAKSQGVGTAQPEVGTSTPKQDPNHRFDISGMPIGTSTPPCGIGVSCK
ncbi:MAG: prepilin-type N-terminal cleavage/methylation domain-containing protein [Candidatus Nitronauta litoralis]|uniref:Prepilin-type N-terminal cleavage/methylation domain-containing protein n=1 Tax=Candidatus Nitronauta litoralis TaxID=2705533 RepID=A0A7T0BXT1_9BACT|nr:MAG: prepilin-type N-terminal cleavage/methylation domain-containing protein [Candidatus Nitronauta litoralis]